MSSLRTGAGRARRAGPAWARTGAVAALALLAAAGWLTASAGPAAAQEREDGFTLERIHGSSDFSARTVSVRWLADGTAWVTAEPDSAGVTELWRVDAETGARTLLLGRDALVPPGEEEPLEVDDFRFSADERRILLFTDAQQVWRDRTKGIYWVHDRQDGGLTPVSRRPGWQMFAKFSPDGGRVAFVREHDLFVTDLETGTERRLTDSGSETIINGTTDWVYEEELGLRDAFRWSPDGRRIAYWQLDQSPIREFYLLEEGSLYPELVPIRYPKAGVANSRVRVGTVEIASGRTTWLDTGGGTWSAGDGAEAGDRYLARMEWAAGSGEVVIQRLERHQNRIDVLLGDVATGETRLLFSETDEAWVDVGDGPLWIEDGARFLWTSERDGFRHVYLYDREGTPVRQLTRGEWEVSGVDGVDERAGLVYVTAAFEGPRGRQLLAVPLDGGEPRVVLGGRGVHRATYAPDFRYLVDVHSTIDTPPTSILYRVREGRAETARVLEDNAELAARLDSIGLAPVEFTRLPAADGTPLEAWMVRPPDFDPGRRYGLLVYVYGGPGSQTVRDAWAGDRLLWHHYMARRGVLVASVDNRGTGGRGRDFKKQTYLRLGQLETADQLAALESLTSRPYVDAGRAGIWGWSYGGYMALNVVLHGGADVAAAASVAPVTDWRLYDTIYTERYMRTPAENPEGYDEGAPLTHAARLESDLLIVHGTADDNVHPQHTVRMVAALEEANRQFRMRIYPEKRHGIAGGTARVNLFGLLTGFLLERLAPAGGLEAGAGATEATAPASAGAAGG